MKHGDGEKLSISMPVFCNMEKSLAQGSTLFPLEIASAPYFNSMMTRLYGSSPSLLVFTLV